MIAPWHRGAAAGIDAVVALGAAALIITPFARAADPDLWAIVDPFPLMWALFYVLMGVFMQGNTLGKRSVGLRITGSGCITCRELRRSGWALIIGLAQLMEGVTHDLVGALGLGLAGLWILRLLISPSLNGEPDFPHNQRTGFQVRTMR